MSTRQYPPTVTYLIVTVMSVAFLTVQTTIPFKVGRLGGGFDAVGYLFTWTSFCYVMSGIFLGWISHQAGPRRVMLVSLTVCALLVLVVSQATAIWQLYALLTGFFVSLCLFWAATEHASTGMHLHLSIMQTTAIYGVAFTLGNSGGLLVSTYLQGRTLVLPFVVAVALMAVVFALVWITVSPQAGFHRATPTDVAAFSPAARARLRRSLLAARLGLVGSYGANAVLMVFLPRYLWEELAFSKPLAGGLTSLATLAMAGAFAIHGWRTGWTHKLLTVRLAPFLAGAGLLMVGCSSRPLIIGLAALIIGIVTGTSYVHNLYYALEEPGQRAQRAGIHEALVGVAFMTAPPLSGYVSRLLHNPQTIFWAGAALAVLLGLLQNIALVATRTRHRILEQQQQSG